LVGLTIKYRQHYYYFKTYLVFYFYFIKNKKIAKELYEIYEEAKDQTMDLIRYSEQAEKLFQDLESEREKRHRFQ
jgi:hypothetical protein